MMSRLWLGLHLGVLLCCLVYGQDDNTTSDGAEPTYHTGQAPTIRYFNVTCDKTARYRSVNGTCNNLDHPLWGAKAEPYLRLLAPAYQNGKSLPRMNQTDGTPLPSPRLVSTTLHIAENHPYPNGTIFAMVWGQFIAHDFSATPADTEATNGPCCSVEIVEKGDDSAVLNGSSCFPIIVPENDPHFTLPSTRCLKLVRSFSVYENGVREQVNELSAYLDGTTVYGPNDAHLEELRTYSGGKMNETDSKALPKSDKNKCTKTVPSDYCLKAGDHRVNVYPPLGALHTIFNRLHNLVATKIAEVHWNYDDEMIFQEARKIIIAIMQHITFSEYLPSVLGQKYIKKYGLADQWSYNNSLDTTLFNVFPTAAFRFGHSMVTDSLLVNGSTIMDVDLWLRPHNVLDNLDSLLNTTSRVQCEKSDRFFSKGMTEHLFQKEPQTGTDVVSLNIQRGRDHGLPPYNHFRKLCGLKVYTNFSEMAQGDLFDDVYNSVDDVDLYSGAMAEIPEDGGVGPTFSCLLGTQFQRIRNGDRFWFETTDRTIGFAKNHMITKVKKTTLADVICLTTQINEIQKRVFEPVGKGVCVCDRNRILPCNQKDLSRRLKRLVRGIRA